MHLADEVLDHLFSNFKVGDHAVAHRADRLDMARRAAQHHLGVIANGEHLLLAAARDDRNDRRLVQNDAPALHIDQRVGGPEVDGHIGREHSKQTTKHLCH